MSLDTFDISDLSASELRFGIVAARYNKKWIDALLERTLTALQAAGAVEEHICILRAPGSNELPYLAHMLARSQTVDSIIALGVVIGGNTNHHNVIGSSTAHALQNVSLDTQIPVVNGILVTNNIKQARARCAGRIDRGTEFARTAVEMAHHKLQFSKS